MAIVLRARTYITEHLAAPLTLDAVAHATGTSRRTIVRAFVEVLNDTPTDYIRRLRLHRIRKALVSRQDAGTSIAAIAARWGMTEPDRMSEWYSEMSGELPNETRTAASEHRRLGDRTL